MCYHLTVSWRNANSCFLFRNQALINYGLQFLYGKGYNPNQPPFFMNRTQMAKTAQLSEFDEELFVWL